MTFTGTDVEKGTCKLNYSIVLICRQMEIESVLGSIRELKRCCDSWIDPRPRAGISLAVFGWLHVQVGVQFGHFLVQFRQRVGDRGVAIDDFGDHIGHQPAHGAITGKTGGGIDADHFVG